MAENTIRNYKCPCCGAPLRFDGTTGRMSCSNCGNDFAVEDMDAMNDVITESSAESQWHWDDVELEQTGQGETVTIECPSCGAEITGDSTTAAMECPYCGNQTIVNQQVNGMFKPDLIIPFKFDKKQAKAALSNFYKGKFLLPKRFEQENKVREITGMYVPFWLYDCTADANITYNCTRVKSWREGQYDVTKTDHFLVQRSGNISYENIPADASNKIDNDEMDSIEPFKYQDGTEFNQAYLSGYLASKYDVTAEDNEARINERVTNSTTEAFRGTVQGYTTVVPANTNINMKTGRARYAMMPVWMLNSRFDGQNYTFVMNGQTGKVAGTLPEDKGKMTRTAIGTFLGVLAVLQIFVFLL